MNDFAAPQGSLCAFTYHLVHAAQEVESRVEGALEEVGLSLAKVKLLRHLYNSKDALPLGTLAEKNSCVKSNVTQLMDRMEAEGLVRRVPDADDRRSVRAQITAEGRRKYEAAAKRLAATEAEVMAGFTPSERQLLIEFLERLRAGVPV
ncbi:MAG: MarR family transcriptional regulator [Gemmatimonadota bacterium]